MTATFRTSNSGSAADPSRPHIILVGLPGAGKSTVGRAVAEKLGRTFLDFDVELERREG
jgi:shikimate kinase